MTDPVQEIKERLNIVDIIGQYVKLTKAGKNYKGLSPFQKEKTPSFNVDPEKGMYYDFSSNRGGDIFTFVQEMEGLDFREALRMLAERAGVELKAENKEARDARTRLYDIMEAACQFYETKLAEHEPSRAYMEKRGVDAPTMRVFRLGYAPDAWQELRDHLTHDGYREQELEQAGLAKRGNRGYYDRFRSRVLFPIRDSAGRVVAFSGRIVGTAADDPENAKYLNSPETPLFDKSRILFGYDIAKQYIRKYGCAIFVEGQMDLVMSHKVGYKNTVAVSGTGLTDHHLNLVKRFSDNILMAFDADAAGIRTSSRGAIMALRKGMDVKVVRIPHGKDPADCILDKAEDWKQAVREAVHIVEHSINLLINEHQQTDADDRTLLLKVRDTVLPIAASIRSSVDKAHFVRLIASRVNVSEEAVWEDLRQHESSMRSSPEHIDAGDRADSSMTSRARQHDTHDAQERLLAGVLFWQDTSSGNQLDSKKIVASAKEKDVDLSPILARYDKEKDILAFQAECMLQDDTHGTDSVLELVNSIATRRLRKERDEVAAQLRRAEAQHDDNTCQDLLRAFSELSSRLEALD